MHVFIFLTLMIVVIGGLTAAVVAIDLWVRRAAARGKYIVRERPSMLLDSANIVQAMRRGQQIDSYGMPSRPVPRR